MNLGQVETNIQVHLDNLRVGERYTFYRTAAPNVGIRATLVRKIPGNRNAEEQIVYMANPPNQVTVPLAFIGRITQSGIGPNDDTAGLINAFLGGRRRRKKTKKKRKTKKRRKKKRKSRKKRKTKKKRKSRKRR